MNPEPELLRRFAEEKSEAAFRELVGQRIGFVYAAALRQVGGDAHLAEEVAQNVFLDLARKARGLATRPTLTGWLYTSTRFAAAKVLRSRSRRLNHETEAHVMNEILSAGAPGDLPWSELRPVLDAAMHELNESDREAILLRYFEGRSFAEVGGAIGLEENAARMRVERALGRLHERLARRGVTSTAAALGVALANQPAAPVPAALAGSIAGASLAGISETLTIMNTIKLLIGLAVGGAAGSAATYLVMHTQQQDREAAATAQAAAAGGALRAENGRLKLERDRLQAAANAATAESPLAALRALVAAERQKLIPPLSTLLRLDQKGALQPAMAELFNLSPAEKAALEKEMAATLESLEALAAANVNAVERPAPNRVTIKFNLYAEDGGKIHDRLLGTLAQTLGAEREAALMTLMGDRFDGNVGSGFGASERTITFERRTLGPSERQSTQYIAIDSFKAATGPGSALQTSSAVTQCSSRADVDRKFPALVKLLPADF